MMTLILVLNCCHNVDSDLHGYMLWGSQYFFCFIISFLVNHFKTIVFKVLDFITERSYSYYDLLILKYFCSKAPAWLSKLAPAHALVMQEEAWNAYPRCKSGLPFPLDSTLCVTCFSLSLSLNNCIDVFLVCKWMPYYLVLKVFFFPINFLNSININDFFFQFQVIIYSLVLLFCSAHTLPSFS